MMKGVTVYVQTRWYSPLRPRLAAGAKEGRTMPTASFDRLRAAHAAIGEVLASTERAAGAPAVRAITAADVRAAVSEVFGGAPPRKAVAAQRGGAEAAGNF